MGQRGPAPKPVDLKILEGNPGKRDEDRSPMDLPIKAPSPPSWLDAEGRREWRRICAALDPARVLTAADRALLTVYCKQWSLFCAASKELDRDGIVTEGSMGQRVRHPAYSVLADCRAALVQLAAQFGLSPASRARISKPVASAEEQLTLFLTGADSA